MTHTNNANDATQRKAYDAAMALINEAYDRDDAIALLEANTDAVWDVLMEEGAIPEHDPEDRDHMDIVEWVEAGVEYALLDAKAAK